jgi:hypothetical protein
MFVFKKSCTQSEKFELTKLTKQQKESILQ